MKKLQDALLEELRNSRNRVDTLSRTYRILFGSKPQVEVRADTSDVVAALRRHIAGKAPRAKTGKVPRLKGGRAIKVLSHLRSASAGQFVPASELLNVSGYNALSTLHATMHKLRREGHKIENRRGAGYRLAGQ